MLRVVRCVLSVVCRLQCAVCCLFVDARWVLFVVRCLLRVACGLSVACCLLIGVCVFVAC